MRFIRNRFLLRSAAVFFLFEMISSTVFPTVSWALTAGPTAPEASSFEPVDTTDMVNLNTGDFTYNIPLLEVSGPSGGYPLSLSYHAGIQPNEDASWVGLGFSLNPGAINRSVSGYADDFNNRTATARTFWEGGESRSYNAEINVGKAGEGSGTIGLAYSEDTYRGFSTQASLRIGSFGISHEEANGVSSTGLAAGVGAATVSTNLTKGGVNNTEFKSTAQGSIVGLASMDASMISTANAVKAITGVGIENFSKKEGNISSRGYNYSATIPTPWAFTVQLGASYRRYWIDETNVTSTHGALYFPTASLPSSTELDTKAYDVYDLTDTNQPLSKSVADESLAGSFVDYDSYQVLGQGIAGLMRPYHFQSYLLRQNKKNGDQYRVKSMGLQVNKKPSFRFVGDFSNRYIHNAALDQFALNPFSFTYDGNRVTGPSENDGYVADKNILPGSKHTEWYTNNQIVNNSGVGSPKASGFIDCSAKGFVRQSDEKIGGFKVTNESGMTYHYALPVYSFDEYQYSGRVDEKGKHYFNTHKTEEKYAYTWLLTAVTGPDYIDINSDGLANKGDYGYWVDFQYGRWASVYDWRNPSEGFAKDLDQRFENFSKGKKEVYYLNAIRTQTQTAIFVKGFRFDAKSIVPKFAEAVLTGPDHQLREVDDGGFDPWSGKYPVSSLKLKQIYLLQNSDFSAYPDVVESILSPDAKADANSTSFKNVIDSLDMASGTLPGLIQSKSIKMIEFKHNYSLCPWTTNSYISPYDVVDVDDVPSYRARKGKLTLAALKIYGKGSVSLIPETKFKYDIDYSFVGNIESRVTPDPYNPAVSVTAYFAKVNGIADHHFKKGEILRFTAASAGFTDHVYHAYVKAVNELAGEIAIVSLDASLENIQGKNNIVFFKTKNPPYNKDFTDLWGLYKVDYNPSDDVVVGNVTPIKSENEARMTTSTSSQSVDVWSLREVDTPLGSKIKIEYEPDQYKSSIKTLANIPIKGIESLSDGTTRLILYEDAGEYGIQQNDYINFRALSSLRYDVINPTFNTGYRFECDQSPPQSYIYYWVYHRNRSTPQTTIKVESVSGNSLIIDYNFTDDYPTANSLKISEQCPNPDNCYKVEDPGNCPVNSCIDMNALTVSPPIFLGGEIFKDDKDKFFTPYGGDLRVKSITLENGDEARSTLYKYSNGVTTYEPLGFATPIRRIQNLTPCLDGLQDKVINVYRDDYQNDMYNKFQFLFANAREMPGPGVMYEVVQVSEQVRKGDHVNKVNGMSEYQFEVFSPNGLESSNTAHKTLVNQFRSQFVPQNQLLNHLNYTGSPILDLKVTYVEGRGSGMIKDFSAIMGNLKRITFFDDNNNKVTETLNQYLHDNFNETDFLIALGKHKNQGTITETFADARIIINPGTASPAEYSLYGLISQKIHYPSIQVSQTTINYKTGIQTKSQNLGFDFYSGKATATLSKDEYGNSWLTKITPAYRKYEALGLGALEGKNMLTQEALKSITKVKNITQNGMDTLELASATLTTWSNGVPALEPGDALSTVTPQSQVWRKKATHTFIGNNAVVMTGNGLYEIPGSGLYTLLSWNENGPVNSSLWRKDSEITLYDVSSHELEGFDINNLYSAVKMTLDQTKVVASVTNSEYGEFAYSGAEENFISGNQLGTTVTSQGNVSTGHAHTGTKSVSGDTGKEKVFSYAFKPKEAVYHVSFWSSSPSAVIKYSLDGAAAVSLTVQAQNESGPWYLIEKDISIQGNNHTKLEVWCASTNNEIYFDDFRVHPRGASMMSYVYNSWGELSHVLGNNNLYTEYRYDESGRLFETYHEKLNTGGVKTGHIEYHYANH